MRDPRKQRINLTLGINLLMDKLKLPQQTARRTNVVININVIKITFAI